jgi:hypothetical protein
VRSSKNALDFGQKLPIRNIATEAGQEKNRRVEMFSTTTMNADAAPSTFGQQLGSQLIAALRRLVNDADISHEIVVIAVAYIVIVVGA